MAGKPTLIEINRSDERGNILDSNRCAEFYITQRYTIYVRNGIERYKLLTRTRVVWRGHRISEDVIYFKNS